MNVNVSRLEFLPNEILIQLFQYVDVRDLFRAFYNLNFHLNTIIRSLNHISFTFLDDTYHTTHNHVSHIPNTSVTSYTLDVYLIRFTNIRCLSIIQLGDEFSQQINADILPVLKHLIIKKWSYNSYSSDFIREFYKKIFSNTFPYLKSCYLPEDNKMRMTDEYTELPSLHILQIGKIDLFIYKSILLLCPNLNLLKFTLEPILHETPVVIKPHLNLIQMIIKTEDIIQSKSDYGVDTCLSFVPNLEQLIIRRIDGYLQTEEVENYDWYASSIVCNLPSLRRFKCYFKAFYRGDDDDHENLIKRMKEIFKINHKGDPYQSELILDVKHSRRTQMDGSNRPKHRRKDKIKLNS